MSSLSVQSRNGLTRNLTEIFNFLRSNAQQQIKLNIDLTSKNKYLDDKIELISPYKERTNVTITTDLQTPPLWVSILDEINYEMTRIQTRQLHLKQIQEKNLVGLNFNDENTSPNQEKIKELTDELTLMFTHTQRLIRSLQEPENKTQLSKSLQTLQENVVSSLLFNLNNLLNEFRTSQSAYLKQLDARAKCVDNFLLDLNPANTSFNNVNLNWNDQSGTFFNDTLIQTDSLAQQSQEELTITQIQELIQNEQMTVEREKEVLKISKSIIELNTLFKDVSALILDQGTILDRIDYNIEHSSIRVKKAFKSVEKAQIYQKDNRKMQLILVLTGIAFFLMLLILITKT